MRRAKVKTGVVRYTHTHAVETRAWKHAYTHMYTRAETRRSTRAHTYTHTYTHTHTRVCACRVCEEVEERRSNDSRTTRSHVN